MHVGHDPVDLDLLTDIHSYTIFVDNDGQCQSARNPIRFDAPFASMARSEVHRSRIVNISTSNPKGSRRDPLPAGFIEPPPEDPGSFRPRPPERRRPHGRVAGRAFVARPGSRPRRALRPSRARPCRASRGAFRRSPRACVVTISTLAGTVGYKMLPAYPQRTHDPGFNRSHRGPLTGIKNANGHDQRIRRDQSRK